MTHPDLSNPDLPYWACTQQFEIADFKEDERQAKWDNYFFKLIEVIKTKSKDPSTQFGCVIVGPDNEIRTTGYNSFPRGINDNVEERMVRPEKYLWFEHSERNAIYNAARVGIPLKGCRLYVDGIPCMDCARGIISVGITRVMYDKTKWDEYAAKQNQATNNSWFFLTEKSKIMFTEAGVELVAVETKNER